MKLVVANVSSTFKKLENLTNIIELNSPHIILLNETHNTGQEEIQNITCSNTKYTNNYHILRHQNVHCRTSDPPFIGSSIYSNFTNAKYEFPNEKEEITVMTVNSEYNIKYTIIVPLLDNFCSASESTAFYRVMHL